MMQELQALLSIASASIPTATAAWFLFAVGSKVFTRCQQLAPRESVKLAHSNIAPGADAIKKPETLPALPSAENEAGPIAATKTDSTGTSPYETMSLSQLRKLARRRGVQAIGDSRKRQSWLDALVCHE